MRSARRQRNHAKFVPVFPDDISHLYHTAFSTSFAAFLNDTRNTQWQREGTELNRKARRPANRREGSVHKIHQPSRRTTEIVFLRQRRQYSRGKPPPCR